MIHNRNCSMPMETVYMTGDTISFEMVDGEPVEALALRQEDGAMLFITVDCLLAEYPLHEGGGRYPGYEACTLRKKLNGDILERFPYEVRSRMVPFDNGDLLRLPTEREIFGENEYGEEEPETVERFELMKQRRNRIAFQGKDTDKWEWYWLQNRSVDSATAAASVASYGYAYYYGASNSVGVRPLFKILNPENPAPCRGGKEEPRAWDEDFDREFYTEEEVKESDARAEAVTRKIEEEGREPETETIIRGLCMMLAFSDLDSFEESLIKDAARRLRKCTEAEVK